MGIPQILMIFILSFSVILHIVKDGDDFQYPKYDGVANFIAKFIIALILYAGNFWG